jgi:hypothetical protein
MQNPHSVRHGDLIAGAAKVHLSPIGMKRKGKSRLWLKDNGWWIAFVEFQPSAWSKGTYLNVGANWLWDSTAHLAFHECKRVGGFTELTEPQSFAVAAERYAMRAAAETVYLCEQFSNLNKVALHLRAKSNGDPWNYYHATMASLANGEVSEARMQFASLLRVDHPVPWCEELKHKANRLMSMITDKSSAQAVVSSEIAATRNLLMLTKINSENLWQ